MIDEFLNHKLHWGREAPERLGAGNTMEPDGHQPPNRTVTLNIIDNLKAPEERQTFKLNAVKILLFPYFNDVFSPNFQNQEGTSFLCNPDTRHH